jgi:hypothetical protein
MRTRISWREKLEKLQQPKIVPIPPKMRRRYPGCRTILIPQGLDVDDRIRLRVR